MAQSANAFESLLRILVDLSPAAWALGYILTKKSKELRTRDSSSLTLPEKERAR